MLILSCNLCYKISFMKTIDLRSDTVTLPSQKKLEMQFPMHKLGDDVFQEDPNVNLLESEAALIAGKNAALLVPSGTMGNLISFLAHCQQRYRSNSW